MDMLVFKLAFCLSLAAAESTTENGNWSPQSTVTVQVVSDSSTKGTLPSTSEHSTISVTNVMPNTTNTSGTVTNSSDAQTIESTTVMKPLNSTSESTATTASQTEPPSTSERNTHHPTATTTTAVKTTTAAVKTTTTSAVKTTTAAVKTTTTAAVITSTTANSSVVNATSQSALTAQGARLSISERNLTITFSVMLGLVALAMVVIKCYRFNNKWQILHQPLTNTEDLNSLTAGPGRLVISEGLYDDHPIYDNVPPATHNEAQF